MQVLVVLGRAHGEVVSRDDLIDQCWGGRIVTDDAINRVIAQIRRVGSEFCQGEFSVQTIRSVGYRLHGEFGRAFGPANSNQRELVDRLREHQKIEFCRTSDAVTLAYSRLGEGYPLVKTPNWHGHLEQEIENPLWRHWVAELSSRSTLLRYDQRGTGMSDRCISNLNFDRLLEDMVTVVNTAGLECFDLLAISQGTLLAVAFAARHPQRVRRLVLINGFSSGWRHSPDPDHVDSWEAMCTLIRAGWGKDSPALRQVYTSQFLPDGTGEQWASWNDFQKVSAAPESAYRILQMFGDVDVADLLTKVRSPTLVMHCNRDQLISLERGRFIASKIPGAEFVILDGRNHLPQPEDVAWKQIQAELRRFLQ
ncbi:alpha/beta fold hydrolase [Sphingomonas daechungensis]|uniref:Alpha/beta hydrolase n=2 Tax=Sphingomonas daechungensis TaxID=1176646 RepID=A0ABX6T5U3_9SPHN|nr:alpha/beta fold hydrolase [Sphingomonas daechungensis]QNP44578.1 alpha/beta hydrolase [Sphingomonas daechungensis]